MKILVVEPDTTSLASLQRFLIGEGHSVVPAMSSEGALRQAGRTVFDAVLMSVTPEGRDAVEMLREFKQVDAGLPVIMLADPATAEKAVDAFKAGALDVLLKPLNLEYLKDNVLTRVTVRSV
jgi:two-component system response regulator HydG